MSERGVHFTDEHDRFRQEVRAFLDSEVAPHADQWEAAGRIPRTVFRRMGSLGMLGLTAPKEHGGRGGDLMFAIALLEELPRSLMGGFCAAVAVQQLAATPPIIAHGSTELQRRYVRPSVEGRTVGALAVTEPGAGSDVQALSTRAEFRGDHYLVTGVKSFVTNAADGDFITMAVRTEANASADGLSLLVVDHDAPGLTISRRLPTLGWHAAGTAEVLLEGVEVPVGHLIGEENDGFAYLMEAFQLERLAAAAAAVGTCDLLMERTAGRVQRRTAFGKPLSRFQALAHRLADLAARVEAARHLVYHAAWLLDRGLICVAECAMAKLVATELAQEVADACLQLYGGWGYVEEAPVARLLRDARAGTIVGGTSEVMREVIARIVVEGRRPPCPAGAAPIAAEPEPAPAEPSEAEAEPSEAAAPAEPPTAEVLVNSLPSRFRPDKAEDWSATFHLQLKGAEAPDWTVRVNDGACTVNQGLEGAPDCLVRMKADTYVAIETGRLNPQTAFMTGRVKVSDLAQMVKFGKVFGAFE